MVRRHGGSVEIAAQLAHCLNDEQDMVESGTLRRGSKSLVPWNPVAIDCGGGALYLCELTWF
jgi:hypothetical protein